MKIVTVKNSIIDLDHPSFDSVASADDISEIGTFSHFEDDHKADAEAELFQKIEETREARLEDEESEDHETSEEEVEEDKQQSEPSANAMGTGDEGSAKGNFLEQEQK